VTVDRIVKFLLIFVPIAIIAKLAGAEPVPIFILSALAIVPLADIMGEATEELAIHTGPKLGGLLNATLGNAAELIITIFALREGLVDLVKASIVGSILGNLLLVLGLSLVMGGIKNGLQKFDPRTAGMNATLVILAVVALAIPSLFDVAIQKNAASELGLSEGVALVMIVLYALSIVYTFTAKHPTQPSAEHDAFQAPHTAKWSIRTSVIVLVVATLGIALLSEMLVSSVEPVTEQLHLTEFFIGIIIIPLVGNIAEYLVAV